MPPSLLLAAVKEKKEFNFIVFRTTISGNLTLDNDPDELATD